MEWELGEEGITVCLQGVGGKGYGPFNADNGNREERHEPESPGNEIGRGRGLKIKRPDRGDLKNTYREW